MRSLATDSPLRELPALGPAWPLAEWLLEAGPIRWSDWGSPEALTWQELEAWQRVSGTPLSPRQVRVLRLLSQEYAAAAGAALDPDCPAPDAPRPEPARVADQVRAAMAALGAKVAP